MYYRRPDHEFRPVDNEIRLLILMQQMRHRILYLLELAFWFNYVGFATFVHAPTDAVGLLVFVNAPTDAAGFAIPVQPVVIDDESAVRRLVIASKRPKGCASVDITSTDDSVGFKILVHAILVVPSRNR